MMMTYNIMQCTVGEIINTIHALLNKCQYRLLNKDADNFHQTNS